ncbi:conjugal transfer protein TraB (plasmid) [Sinorhizobium fredii NGR234]|uniref:Probable conjugal transfer protein TraB n=1 Tax=Sinorhizobium fredii (strain NBRC 101917 / NGR234) TaxID=394 RepID=TRAB_SINFN|nr:conjugal transfer protein TraB [Sinorhizobium fredii]P55416.1 RecName: Full=Probable conjugal transfer protein TraB [Sinorhizobium fredii NGR234]pir/T02780/ probable conjugal transfer protein traB - Rhizobium sp. plasmid pNGR234a [Rhizobium sp.]AAB91646.1 conjugal transfer protein TraB [Sinorhizobium fredii NGR234]
MRRDHLQPRLLTIASIVVGTVGWSGYALLLPVALAFPILWSRARTRRVAALVSAGYFLAASRGLPQGVAAFYTSDLWPGLLLWLCASGSFVVVHTVLWTKRSDCRPFRYLLAAVLMAVPPMGITGWAHPVTAAGILFPGWGWWGLVATTAGLMGLVTRMWPAVAIAFTGFWLWSAANWTESKLPASWQGVDLKLGSTLGRNTSIQRHRDLIATVKDRASGGVRNVVLPESALGFWTPTFERLWVKALQGTEISVISGAAAIDATGYDNVLVTLSADGGRVLYRERMPVPGSMWQPWGSWLGESDGARAHFFANPVVTVGNSRVAPLICYEQLVVWPTLQSMLYEPDLIVAVGNGWWTKGTSIVAIQRVNAIAWAKLFAKPLVLSFNT